MIVESAGKDPALRHPGVEKKPAARDGDWKRAFPGEQWMLRAAFGWNFEERPFARRYLRDKQTPAIARPGGRTALTGIICNLSRNSTRDIEHIDLRQCWESRVKGDTSPVGRPTRKSDDMRPQIGHWPFVPSVGIGKPDFTAPAAMAHEGEVLAIGRE
jgi:hypothetical protein